MPDLTHRTAVATLAIVVGDADRCELHDQCEGLSRRVFRAHGHRVALAVGAAADVLSLVVVQRSVRSCPTNALTLVGAEPAARPGPKEQ